MGLFDELCGLLGKTLDDPVVADFLARHPDHKVNKPDSGDPFVVFRDGGFDLLFRDREERHSAFRALPHGIAFTDRHADLAARFGTPSRDSAASLGAIHWAEWELGEVSVYFRYDSEEGASRPILVGACKGQAVV